MEIGKRFSVDFLRVRPRNIYTVIVSRKCLEITQGLQRKRPYKGSSVFHSNSLLGYCLTTETQVVSVLLFIDFDKVTIKA